MYGWGRDNLYEKIERALLGDPVVTTEDERELQQALTKISQARHECEVLFQQYIAKIREILMIIRNFYDHKEMPLEEGDVSVEKCRQIATECGAKEGAHDELDGDFSCRDVDGYMDRVERRHKLMVVKGVLCQYDVKSRVIGRKRSKLLDINPYSQLRELQVYCRNLSTYVWYRLNRLGFKFDYEMPSDNLFPADVFNLDTNSLNVSCPSTYTWSAEGALTLLERFEKDDLGEKVESVTKEVERAEEKYRQFKQDAPRCVVDPGSSEFFSLYQMQEKRARERRYKADSTMGVAVCSPAP
jgi:hypothetical protein